MAVTVQEEFTPALTILDAIEARIPSRRNLAVKLMTEYADITMSGIKVKNVMNGMRGLPVVLWEVSQTDENGVKYHGKSLLELEGLLPKWKGTTQLSPEALLWFLYTAAVPTRAQLENFVADLVRRSELPEDVTAFCDAIPVELPPTTHMIMSFTALSRHSKFAAALESGSDAKADLWRYAFEDALDATARFPILVARIYSNIYHQGRHRHVALDHSSDLSHNFAMRIGRGSDVHFVELIRLYWSLHMDHGSNVSAHAARLCSSAWTDVYNSLSSAIIAAMGPLHAKAIMTTVKYNIAMSDALGPDPTDDAIKGFVIDTISRGQVVPGYGHAVLRGKDPRFEFISEFTKTHKTPEVARKGATGTLSLSLMKRAHAIVPDLLRVHIPRMKNPASNVDALSGCIMLSYGFEADALVTFVGCSRAMGISAQYVWDRALGLPLERPLSVTMEDILAIVNGNLVNAMHQTNSVSSQTAAVMSLL